MKLFRTSDISVIAYCQEMFQFDLPSAIFKKRAEKFDSALLNWHYIELLVKILCIFWFVVSFYIMYASTYGWIKMNKGKESVTEWQAPCSGWSLVRSLAIGKYN